MEFEIFSLPTFSGFNISSVLNKPVLVWILIVFFFFYCVISGILMYHWSAYGMRHRGIILARSLYIFVSIVLFVIAGLAISYY